MISQSPQTPSPHILQPAVLLAKNGTLVHDVFDHVDPARMRLHGGARDRASLLSWCPHHPAGHVAPYATTCSCRKPLPGPLLLRAARELGIDLERSWMEAGRRASCHTALLRNGGETEWVTGPHRAATLLAKDLVDAARSILDALRPARIKPHLRADPPTPPVVESLIEPLFPPKPASKLFRKPATAPAVSLVRQPAPGHSPLDQCRARLAPCLDDDLEPWVVAQMTDALLRERCGLWHVQQALVLLPIQRRDHGTADP